MRRGLTFSVLLLAGLGLVVTTSAGKAPAPKDTPVKVAFAEPGYAMQNDSLGDYTHGIDGVSAIIISSGTGNLALKTHDTNSVFVRKLFLDFTGACSGICDPPFTTVTVEAFMSTSGCQNAGGLRDMPTDTSQLCNLNVNFGTPGTGWFIRFGEYAGTDSATVTRVSGTSWTIDVPEDGVARLLSYPTKGRYVLTPRGDFAMPVHLTVTLQP